MTETRLVMYTNDAVLLSISAFPFYILRWNILTYRTRPIEEQQQSRVWKLVATVGEQLKSVSPDKANPHYLTIAERMKLTPQDYCPKITWMECVTPTGDHLKWRREMIVTRTTVDHDYQRYVLEAVNRVWENGVKYYREYPGFTPEHRRPSILFLEEVDGSQNKARDRTAIWEIWQQIVGVNDFSRTPICEPLYRVRSGREVWEYRPIDGQGATP